MTGALLNEEFGKPGCAPCEYDFDWVFRYPSTLMWIDKIVLTPSIMKVIDNEIWPTGKESCYATVLKMYFDVLREHNLVETRIPDSAALAPYLSAVGTQADWDRSILAKEYPEAVRLENNKEVPGGFMLEDFHYCTPRVIALYLSLILSRAWDTTLLLNAHSQQYLRYRFGLYDREISKAQNIATGFCKVFSGMLPEIGIAPSTGDHSCWNCANMDSCDKSQLTQIEQ